MKKIVALVFLITIFTCISCNKSTNNNTVNFETLKTKVLGDFVNTIAVPSYLKLDNAADDLLAAVQNLNTNTTDVNLQACRTAWKNMRTIWEQSEGYLFGPVEDNDYDPKMDTWPSDYVQMDSLLSSTNSLSLAEIQNITFSLRGYHPIEYIIFGNNASRTAVNLTARQKLYLISLAEDLKNTCHDLYLSWTTNPVNFSEQVIKASAGSTVYAKKKEVYLAITEALIGISEEVGEGKMKEPYDAHDASIVESPYSGNSVNDFRNNIIGLQNVYLGNLGTANANGINDLVAAKNIALDNKLQNQMTAAISSFSNITLPYGEAIISQRTLCLQTMTALNALKETLENELKPFIIQYIKD